MRAFYRSRVFQLAVMVILFYVTSYVALSRYALRFYPVGKQRHIFYVPADPFRIFTNETLLSCHTILSWIYYPIWAVDHRFFDGPQYVTFCKQPNL